MTNGIWIVFVVSESRALQMNGPTDFMRSSEVQGLDEFL
jgi:hypothetical protein